MAARAVIVPFGVSTATLRLVSIAVAGVDSWTASPSASAAMQCAETLPAESVGIAFGGFREIHRRYLRQLLAAAEWAEHEFDRWPPVAEIVRQRLRARDVALARGVGDGAIGAHLRGKKSSSSPSRA